MNIDGGGGGGGWAVHERGARDVIFLGNVGVDSVIRVVLTPYSF